MSMHCFQIASLQNRYPDRILVALDTRTAVLHKDSETKDLYRDVREEYDIRVRKPREREKVPLTNFDDSLELFIHIEDNMVYYMPGSNRQYPTYATHTLTDNEDRDTFGIVSEMAEMALKQSLSDQGEMQEGEARIFWMENLRPDDTCSLVHVTALKLKREYRIVAELGPGSINRYFALFSICIPIE